MLTYYKLFFPVRLQYYYYSITIFVLYWKQLYKFFFLNNPYLCCKIIKYTLLYSKVIKKIFLNFKLTNFLLHLLPLIVCSLKFVV